MKIFEGFKMLEVYNSIFKDVYSIELQRFLYGLKQFGWMWYNRFREYLQKEGCVNNTICPRVFIKISKSRFSIIAVYVDDLNIIGNPKELEKTTNL